MADVWGPFSEQVTGEFEGATASFEPQTGATIPLDPYYVPQAYRDWGVELYDWQTTCSSLAKAEEVGKLRNICRCMMPTVGCEADAVAFTEELQATEGPLRAAAPGGSYVAGPTLLSADEGRARVEFCLPLALLSQQQQQPQQPRERIRVVHRLQVNWMTKQWELSRIDVHKEKYDGPFKGQVDLCGCGGGMPAFSQTPRISEERARAAQEWPLTDCWSYDIDAQGEAQLSQSPPGSSPAANPGAAARTLLPLGAVLFSRVHGDKGDVELQLSVAVGEKQNRVALCSYTEGRMKQAVLSNQGV